MSEFTLNLIGNQPAINFLGKLIKRHAAGQTLSSGVYVFAGLPNLGKTTAANSFAQALFCQNKNTLPCGVCPNCRAFAAGASLDFFVLKKEEDKKNISIEQARNLINQLSLSAFSRSYKIAVIEQAETLSEAAGNALLKTLEEPHARVLIILLTTDVDRLPLTIVSRSQLLLWRQTPLNKIVEMLGELGAKRPVARDLARLANGRPGLAVSLWKNYGDLQNFLAPAKLFLNSLGQDINQRLLGFDQLWDKKLTGQAAVAAADGWLEQFIAVTRDLLLYHQNLPELTRFLLLADELQKNQQRFSARELLELQKRLTQARMYMAGNVGPKNVLENVLINIS